MMYKFPQLLKELCYIVHLVFCDNGLYKLCSDTPQSTWGRMLKRAQDFLSPYICERSWRISLLFQVVYLKIEHNFNLPPQQPRLSVHFAWQAVRGLCDRSQWPCDKAGSLQSYQSWQYIQIGNSGQRRGGALCCFLMIDWLCPLGQRGVDGCGAVALVTRWWRW